MVDAEGEDLWRPRSSFKWIREMCWRCKRLRNSIAIMQIQVEIEDARTTCPYATVYSRVLNSAPCRRCPGHTFSDEEQNAQDGISYVAEATSLRAQRMMSTAVPTDCNLGIAIDEGSTGGECRGGNQKGILLQFWKGRAVLD